MKDTTKIIEGVLIFALAADVFGFMVWVLSGQVPADNFYLGTITAHVVAWVAGIN